MTQTWLLLRSTNETWPSSHLPRLCTSYRMGIPRLHVCRATARSTRRSLTRPFASAVRPIAHEIRLDAPVSVYVHWPYCQSKCTYCAFNKYHIPAGGQDHDRMERALLTELRHALTYDPNEDAGGPAFVKRPRRRKLNSVYFGGGTPSLARPLMISKVLEYLRSVCDVPNDMEVTLEGNPTSVEVELLKDFKAAGANRLSLGLQALGDKDLRFFGRDHSAAEAHTAVEKAQGIFHRISLDFIWGRPGQTLAAWESELKRALSFGATHYSLYQLTVERGTPLFKDVAKGAVVVPDDDLAADMYEKTVEMASENGYHQYEVSSFAWHGLETNRSQHNQSYWRGYDYIGIGPGAHGRVYGADGTRFRTFRTLDPNSWMTECETTGQGMRRVVPMTLRQTLEELVLLGLRTMDGVSFGTIRQHAGVEYSIDSIINIAATNDLVSGDLLEWVYATSEMDAAVEVDGRLVRGLRPTRKGLAVIDRVVPEVIA
ncbi:uncharacterized protein EV422DRAFT_307655 [Fimicolochytrium jonesii]|uniref:uncharacterized protein n=1 Tax=Fimicolochytrium jonesii TaxID=1396493 RepID=UPI0022FE1BAE|nr:uncharacterized protein EV422DRAFT_307655 [Fimicolochytrium jonesii]KAI8824131.1 hypothetical protein EV422DRAFT_307655 [Fimicolochytrium jonesii]